MKLRNFIFLLLSIAAVGFLYWKYFRPGPPAAPPKPPPAKEQPPKQAVISRLSTFVDSHIDAIFSPLEGVVPPVPHHELRKLRENLIDTTKLATPAEKPMYDTAVNLCDTLLAAVKERERAALNLADSRSKPVALSLSGDKARDEADKRKFFEHEILRRWLENSKTYRDKVNALYKRLRDTERQLNAQG